MHARACAASVLLLMAAAVLRASAPPLRVVDDVDLSRYAGRWYEVARLPNRFQERCVGDAVARYTVRPDGRMDVVNQCRTADGRIDEARGIARRAGNGKNNATLQVRFAPAIFSFLPMVWADYWIIGLGPDYTWAVVGAPSREYLWILSRSPQLGRAAYEQAIEIAKGKGFDATRVIRTDHKG